MNLMVERSRDWMDQADLGAGFNDWAYSSAQQSADKAVFQRLGAEAWGYSVYDLLINLQDREKVSNELLECALELDKAYIPARYLNAHPSPSPRRRYTRKEAERMIKDAEEIIKFYESVLSKA